MSGFENYRDELARVDREILYHAAVCRLDPSDRVAMERAAIERQQQAPDAAWENLRGLLVLRLKVETEMLELGFSVPPLGAPVKAAAE